MDRRQLLKAAAALPAVAMAPAAAVDATTLTVDSAIDTAVAPAKLSPYQNYVWEWFVSRDGETYYHPFPTKEQALEYAQSNEYAIVAECIHQDFNLGVDGYWLIDHINESNAELIGEGEGIECTNKQQCDLEAMVKQAIEAWVVKHGISLTAWTFEDTRNQTDVATAKHSEKSAKEPDRG